MVLFWWFGSEMAGFEMCVVETMALAKPMCADFEIIVGHFVKILHHHCILAK